jgi:SNF2 family DNA or RNA helicase
MKELIFKTKSYKHQLDGLNISILEKGYALFMHMGTGKSKVAIDTIANLRNNGLVDGALIIGNNGSYQNWVDYEIPKHMPDQISHYVTYWDSNAKKELSKTYETLFRKEQELKILVVNIEAIATKRASALISRFTKEYQTILILDESTTVKNPSALRTKAAIKIGAACKYRRILAGEPSTKSPLDLYSQVAVLGPGLLGFTSFYAFRARYADMLRINAGGRAFNKIIGYKNLEELSSKLSKISYRVTKEECLDLPPKVYQTYSVSLTEEQAAMYKTLREEALIELETGLVTAPLVVTKLLRLHQLVCGHLTNDEGQVIKVPSNRISALVEILEETQGKVIIWATYRHDIQEINRVLSATYGQESVVSYYGDTDSDARSRAVELFQDPASGTRFFVSNPKTGGYGITLTSANTVIYYSNNFDLEVRLQSEDRAHRIGQTKSVTYIDMVAKGTIDEKVISALREKKKLSVTVLGDQWKEWI